MLKAIKPSPEYLTSYFDACVESWDETNHKYIIHNPHDFDKWSKTIFVDYENSEIGRDLPEGFVSSVTYWVVDGSDYIGTINIRPVLNDFLRTCGGHLGIFIKKEQRGKGLSSIVGKMAMDLARELVVDDYVLLTCLESNPIAIRSVLSNYADNIHETKITDCTIEGKKQQVRNFMIQKTNHI